MKVIVLKTSHNTGKTETIRNLYYLLEADTENYQLIESKYSIFGKKKQSPPLGRDCFAIFENKKKPRVGISSYGDNYEIIIKSLKEFEAKECDVVISACLTRGNTHSAIKEDDCNPIFIDKTITELKNRTELNLADAKVIKSAIYSM